jgi:hypothetical protein
MAFTDTDITAYAFPQDGASPGIADTDADWNNAAFLGALAKAKANNYAPQGLDIVTDHVNEQFTLTAGLAFIEDKENIPFRLFSDSEINRSEVWTTGYILMVETEEESNISFETTTGKNFVYLGFTRQAQNDVFVRVADDEADAPSKSVKLGEIDASADSKREQNRVAGFQYEFLGKRSTNGFVNQADLAIPDSSFDEYKIKFINVEGDAASGNVTLLSRVSNVNSGSYFFRTTQNNTQQATRFKLYQGRPDRFGINGELFVSQKGGLFTFDNRLTSNQEKQFAFSGGSTDPAITPLSSLQLFFTSGQINAEINVWGRNNL